MCSHFQTTASPNSTATTSPTWVSLSRSSTCPETLWPQYRKESSQNFRDSKHSTLAGTTFTRFILRLSRKGYVLARRESMYYCFWWNYIYACLPLQMAQLSNLYLQDNLMMKIPFASFSHVSQLKTLDVSRNRIENLLDSHYASGAVKVIIRSFPWQFPCLSMKEKRGAQSRMQ